VPLPLKKYDEPSVFTAENLLREARRQKLIPSGSVPKACLLDPDGDIVRCLLADNHAAKCPFWTCYHTDLYFFEQKGFQIGVLGCAVGASFAVLVALGSNNHTSACNMRALIGSCGIYWFRKSNRNLPHDGRHSENLQDGEFQPGHRRDKI